MKFKIALGNCGSKSLPGNEEKLVVSFFRVEEFSAKPSERRKLKVSKM